MNYVFEDPNIVAKYILHKVSSSQKKLHKLLYYAFGWYLYIYNEEDNINNLLFPNSFQAWVHGPVLRQIYPVYSKYGFKEMEVTNFNYEIDDEIKTFLDDVINAYGGFDANTLEERTHSDLAWIKARGDLEANEPCKVVLNLNDIYKSFDN